MFTIAQRIGAIPRNPVRCNDRAVYQAEERNYCPGCGGSHWILDRRLAECGSCAAVLPIAETGTTGPDLFSAWLARTRNARLLTEGL